MYVEITSHRRLLDRERSWPTMAWIPKMLPAGHAPASVRGYANLDEQELAEREQRVAGAEIKITQREKQLHDRAVDLEANHAEIKLTTSALVAQRMKQQGRATELRKWQAGLQQREAELKRLLHTVHDAVSVIGGAPPPTVPAECVFEKLFRDALLPTAGCSIIPEHSATDAGHCIGTRGNGTGRGAMHWDAGQCTGTEVVQRRRRTG